jgi:hypothetical protein
MYKNNSRVCSNIKGCSPLQFSCNMTGLKPAIGYYSYTNRWGPFNENHISLKIQLKQKHDFEFFRK